MPESVECWIDDFKEFVQEKGEDLPLKSGRFEYYLERWPKESDKGRVANENQLIVFVETKLMISKIRLVTTGSKYSNLRDRFDLKIKWDRYIEAFKETAPDGL